MDALHFNIFITIIDIKAVISTSHVLLVILLVVFDLTAVDWVIHKGKEQGWGEHRIYEYGYKYS